MKTPMWHTDEINTIEADDAYVYRNTDRFRTERSRLQDGTLDNYIHYSSDLTATTNAHTADLSATEPDRTTTPTDVEDGARIVVDQTPTAYST